MDIAKLKGRTIVDTREDRYGNETMVLDDGTEITAGDQGVFGVQLTHCEDCNAVLSLERIERCENKCADCRARANQQLADEIGSRMAKYREVAMIDTPALDSLRAILET